MGNEKKTSSLYKVLNGSYQKKSKQKNTLADEGYHFDEGLSNHNQQVYYHPGTKKLVYSVSGTHNIKDWGTDAMLGLGMLKKTKRYKEAHRTYEAARAKYNPTESTVTGHSLGGAIASRVGKGSDKIVTFNKGATFGEKKRKNEVHISTRGDPVSLLAHKEHRLKYKSNPLDAHSTNHLKYTKYTI